MTFLMLAQAASGGSLELGSFGSGVLGTIVGALISLAMFRGRLDVYAARFADLEKRIDKDREDDKKTLARTLEELERRFSMQCQVMTTDQRALSEDFKAWTREARASLNTSSKDSARREEYLLELVLGIAHKSGVRHRFSDVLTNLQNATEAEG